MAMKGKASVAKEEAQKPIVYYNFDRNKPYYYSTIAANRSPSIAHIAVYNATADYEMRGFRRSISVDTDTGGATNIVVKVYVDLAFRKEGQAADADQMRAARNHVSVISARIMKEFAPGRKSAALPSRCGRIPSPTIS